MLVARDKGAYSKIENDNGLFVLRKVGQFKLPYNGPGIIELAKSYNVMIRARDDIQEL
ncbi:hypothetical protein BGX31_008328 [Mortierella sp. GBA43]|nr:hypothetical protein BGX31_008328 [Mortierella sp. GBA43]